MPRSISQLPSRLSFQIMKPLYRSSNSGMSGLNEFLRIMRYLGLSINGWQFPSASVETGIGNLVGSRGHFALRYRFADSHQGISHINIHEYSAFGRSHYFGDLSRKRYTVSENCNPEMTWVNLFISLFMIGIKNKLRNQINMTFVSLPVQKTSS